jgi:oligopeptide/dipeptide ABC transporter ATP-binding protein
MSSSKLLWASSLSIGIDRDGSYYPAVDGIDFYIGKGEILGLVGESGCGKSMTALAITGLLPDGLVIRNGSVLFEGENLIGMPEKEMARLRGRAISMVFQEPMSSLNPLMKIGKQVSEAVRLHDPKPKREAERLAEAVLGKVGLQNPKNLMQCYPHQLSGGMQQRVMIAMAIISNPKLMIADEPTTALDVTMQAQILDLLKSINQEYGMAMLFISHDLGVVSRFCDRMAVMYAGKIVEEGTVSNIFKHPVHEYTRGLLESIPRADSRGKTLASVKGRVPNIFEKRMPCAFAPRCQKVQDRCLKCDPPNIALSQNHTARCILAENESEINYASI